MGLMLNTLRTASMSIRGWRRCWRHDFRGLDLRNLLSDGMRSAGYPELSHE
jgi:hypothetical protein